MRVALLASASAVALAGLAMPAAAGSGFSGVGQVFVGVGSAEDFGFPSDLSVEDPFLIGAKGKGYWPLTPGFHMQLDLFAQHTDSMMFDGAEGWDASDASEFGAALHLIHPFADRARFGLAGSIWSNEVFDFSPDGTTDIIFGLAALEGQFFGTDWTLTGQFGIVTEIDCEEGDPLACIMTMSDGEFVRGKARYFLDDNTALNVEVLRMWGSFEDNVFGEKSVALDSTSLSFEAEHKFEGSPFSGFITVSHEQIEATNFIVSGVDTSTLTLGLKFYFDQATIRSNDRTGAEFDTPTFGNALELGSAAGLFVGSP